MFRFRRRTQSFDERFYKAVAEEAVKSGWDQESEEIPGLAEALEQIHERFSSRVEASLHREMRRFTRGERAQHAKFQRRVRKFWGDALDRYQAIMHASGEAGPMLLETISFDTLSDAEANVAAALFSLHARACRVAFEVFHLLSGGFPSGALARCRTLHELAVTALVIGEYGKQSQYPDLAERFLLHHHVTDHQDALQYQNSYSALNMHPFSADEVDAIKDQRDLLVARFGTPYKEAYGWAAPIVPTGKRVDFRTLEEIANISHLRSYYKWASHEVHSDSKGIRLNIAERGSQRYHKIGAVNFGLADPGQMALISLGQCTTTMLLGADSEPSPLGIVMAGALQSMLVRTLDSFAAAERAVAAAEGRINGSPEVIVGRFGVRRVRVKAPGS